MAKPSSKSECYWWSVINKQVKYLSDVEMHFCENDKTYAKRQASKARRRADKLLIR